MQGVGRCLIENGDRLITRETTLENAARGASAMASLGVGWGDTVAVMLRNDATFLEVMFACDHLGAYSVAVNWHFQPDEVAYILRDSAARILVIHSDLLPGIRATLPAGVTVVAVPTREDICRVYGISEKQAVLCKDTLMWSTWIEQYPTWAEPVQPSPGSIIYTSGTTGRPKGVKREPLDEDAAERSRRSRAYIQGSEEGMRALMASPLYHAGPNATARTALSLASYLNIMPRFDAEEMLRLIEHQRITNLSVVPIMFVRMLALPESVRRRYDLSSLRQVIHGAGPCPPETKRRMIDWLGPIISETYGSTEVGLTTRCTSEEWLARPGTVGRVVDGVSIRVMDEQGNELPRGEQGEIFIRNDNQAPFRYLNAPEATEAVTRDGHITNGDVGYLDDAGYLFITDRKRDMIISGGVNIYPAEIEAALLQCPGVKDCAVFGVPDEQFGEAVAAAVVPLPEDPADSDRVKTFLAERIARYKVPRVIAFHDDLPRESMGKVFKNQLRETYWKGHAAKI